MTANLSKLALALAATALLSAPALAGNEGNAASNHSAVFSFADESPIPGGSATLLRSVRGVSFSAQAAGLEPEAAYTVWWIIFNNPKKCQHPEPFNDARCGLGDVVPDTAVNASVTWATGRVSDAHGFASFDAHLIRGAGRTSADGFGPGLVGNGAEIHLVYLSHGPADAIADLESALTGFSTCPDPENPTQDDEPECIDFAFSVFAK